MTPRRIGAALALLGAVMILFGTFTMRWLTPPAPHEGGVGLTGVEMCREGNCKTQDWEQLLRGTRDKDLELLKTAALVALIGSVLAASVIGAVGVMGLATPRSLSVPTILSVIGAVLALLGAIATVVLLRKYFKDDEMAFGYSFYVYGAGCVLGAIGSIVSRGGQRYATARGPTQMSS
jgi:hypothetical protein